MNSLAKTFRPIIFGFILVSGLFLSSHQVAFADVLFPGNISSCGELAVTGTYTLTSDVTASPGQACFTVSSNDVTLDGFGFTVFGGSAWAIDARAYDNDRVTLTNGANAYTNLIVNNIVLSGFTGGVNISGNTDTNGSGANAGYGGAGGDVAVFYSPSLGVTANGGNTSTYGYGGVGGNISFTDENLNISTSNISALGGTGTTGRNTDGGLTLSYTGTFAHSNVTLSTLSYLNENLTSFGTYVGGTYPIVPGTVSSCGTLAGSGTYTLAQDITNISGTCFTLNSNDVLINGAGYSIIAAPSNTSFAVRAGSFSGLTIASTTVTDFSNLVISSSTVTISGNNLDLSNQFIAAGSLTLSYTGSLTKTGATATAFSALTVNGTSYGAQAAGVLMDWVVREQSRGWRGITSSADGTRLVAGVYGGQIYTSADSGATWTARDSARNWYSVTSSADGTRLAAVVLSGQIYTSTDSGVTWAARDSVRNWYSVTSSADGTKLAAVVSGGQIYTSTNSGATWSARDSNRSWQSVASSADGTKLAATVNGGQIYTSTDSGVTWAARDSVRNWYSVTSSADGTKLAAVVYGGQIYTSTDSGVTWTARDSVRSWRSVASSADGTRLVAGVYGGQIYTSTDSGATWSARDSARNWYSVTSSADGTRLAAVVLSGQIYAHQDDPASFAVDILVPVSSSTVSTWSPIVSWGTATSCYYSYNNFTSTSTANCALNGSDISNPGYGDRTLYVKGIDANGTIIQKSSTYYLGLPITPIYPIAGTTATSSVFSVNWDPTNAGNITSCYYSYDDFISTSTANCASEGSDISVPVDGSATLYLKAVDSNGLIGNSNTSFIYPFYFARDSNRSWLSITSSSDGTRLAAVVTNGQIYTSTDSGSTWTARESNRNWRGITSSADGTKLAAFVQNGQIYTSTDSGVTWTARDSNRTWYGITSSADGTKLAAIVSGGGQIYTSTDSGVTWTARDSNRSWYSVTSSSDGTKLAAVVSGGQIYSSTDSGVTWTARDSNRSWFSITSSADGTKLAAVVYGGQIYTSTNSGVTWTARDSNRTWYDITSSADGTKLAVVVNSGQIYTSTDSGVTWTARDSSRNWLSITSSADGTKLASVVGGGQIYTHQDINPSLKVDLITPSSGATLSSWSPTVSWGTATSCYYSYDNFTSTSTANCALGGSDVSNPGLGSKTLSLRGIDLNGTIVQKDTTFSFGVPSATNPTDSAVLTLWNPSINWDPASLGNISSCYYSYDNFISTSTVDCLGTGSDIFSPTVDGTSTLSLKVSDSNGNIGTTSIAFSFLFSWTSHGPSADWNGLAASSDGMKLIAAPWGGNLQTSSDGGLTWVDRGNNNLWTQAASSADGTKLLVGAWTGRLQMSTTSGATWFLTGPSANFYSAVAASADGTVLATSIYNAGSRIYVSTDSGTNWVARGPVLATGWNDLTISSNGAKMAAVPQGSNQIYTSTDYGVTWTARDSNRSWSAIRSSADGVKLIAFAGSQIYVSSDSGITWTARGPSKTWSFVAISGDGSKLAATVNSNGQVWTSNDFGLTWTARESARAWKEVVFSNDGSRLAVAVSNAQIYTFNSNPSALSISRPVFGESVLYKNWSPLVNWSTSVSCYYSYNNFSSTSTASCLNVGSDILPPSSQGVQTLYVRGIDGSGVITTVNTTFDFDFILTARDSTRNWVSITSSSDGTKLAAVVNNGQIYTSTNSGVNWTARDSNRSWRSVTSSSDGTKLVAVVNSGQIYTSTNSGVNWTARNSNKNWWSVTSSSDGTKLAAVVNGGQIYTSTDSGVTWTARDSNRSWYSVTSSSDGTKLAAVVSGGQIYTSTNSGVNWTARDSNRTWNGITSSSDGTKLAAVVNGGQIYTSTNSGVNWTARDSNRTWYGITSSADGTKLAAVVNNSQIYTSTDSGVTWTARDSNKSWWSVVSSSDGAKLFGVVLNGQIYTSALLPTVTSPAAGATVNSWAPVVSWDRSSSCQYSYDNTNWTTASCTGTGSEIAVPSSIGSLVLYIQGTDFLGTVATSSSSFTYLPLLTSSVSGCGAIASSGTYTLSGDISGVTGTCFVVSANNVTINGAGHSITAAGGNTSYAISAGNSSNLVLQDISISGFGGGLVNSYSSVSYTGTDVTFSTTTASTLSVIYTGTLNAIETTVSNLLSFVINSVDLQSFVAGLFSWSQQSISSCGALSSSGVYTLTQDISNVSGTCFTIGARAVIIDGDGHTITGANGNTDFAFVATSTNANAYSNIAVKNLTLVGFSGGVDARGADGVTGDVSGKLGGNVSLYSVTFPTSTISVDASGGDGFYENNTTAEGGYAGDVKAVDSTLGAVIMNGGDTNGDLAIGSNNGAVGGGTPGSLSSINSTITLTTANYGGAYTPGCMDNSFTNYDSSATYDDGTCTNLTIGTEIGNPANSTISGPIAFWGFSNSGVIEGDAEYHGMDQFFGSYYGYDTLGNIGTTTGFANFVDDYNYGGGPNNYGYVGGGANFTYYTSNYGTIDGATIFQYGSNNGIINGSADFTQNGSYAGYNYGTVNGDATFFGSPNGFGTYNYGTVTGTTYYYYGCANPTAYNYESTALNDDGFSCQYVGSNLDNPSGNTVLGPIYFYGLSNFGTVTGDAFFYSGGANQPDGIVTGNADFTNGGSDQGFNYGTVQGDATFQHSPDDYYGYPSFNQGTVSGSTYYYYGCMDPNASNYNAGVLNDDATCLYFGSNADLPAGRTATGPITFTGGYSNYGTVNGDATFDVGSYNFGTTTGAATFNEFTSNAGVLSIDGSFTFNGTGIVGGTIYDVNAAPIVSFEFSNGSVNSYTVTGGSTFDDGTYNIGEVVGTATFAGSSYNEGTVTGDALLNDGSFNLGSVSGDAFFNTTYYASTTPSGGIFSLENAPWQGSIGGVVYGSDSNPITEYRFYGGNFNSSTILGNAVFNSSSYNSGIVTGNVLLNDTGYNVRTVNGDLTLNTTYYASTTPSNGLMVIADNTWQGSVGGTIYGSDNLPITNFSFIGSRNNATTITGTVSFSDSAYNAGTINGTAAFGNNRPFRMGTINGTSTLMGTNQTITGSNSVTILTKQLGRDTLYLGAGATLAVGSVFIGGVDGNNLLTIRSNTPGSYASINISGDTSGLNFIRLKDIHNTGTTIDFRGRTVYDDGGNTGFIFNPSSQPGQHTFVPPSTHIVTPTERAATAAQAAAIARATAAALAALRSNSGTVSAALQEFRRATATTLPTLSLPTLAVGRLPTLVSLPTFGGTGAKSFSFADSIAKFLFAPLPDSIQASLGSAPRLKAYFDSIGITTSQSLVRISTSPMTVPALDAAVPGIYSVSKDGKDVRTQLSSDGKVTLLQYVQAKPGDRLLVSIVPTDDARVTATFDGKPLSFGASNSAFVIAPNKAGSYVLKSSASPISLVVRVVPTSNVTVVPTNGGEVKPSGSLWHKVLSFFGF
ncbi:MAG: hypothetical protein WC763_04095 [Candidatus Paceibacterota bacterium]